MRSIDDRPPAKTGQFLLMLGVLAASLALYYYISFLPRSGSMTDQATQALLALENRVNVELKTDSAGQNYHVASATDDRIMSTTATVSFWSSDGDVDKLKKQVTRAFWELYQVQALCNIFDDRTEASRINRLAHERPVKCSEAMWELLTAARNAYKASEGAFDITSKPLMDLWGFYRKRGSLPTGEEIELARSKVGLDKVVFDDKERTVFFPVSGMSFDFGGIAKGFAVDRALAGAKSAGAADGVINLAGNMYCLGRPEPGRDKFNIGIQNPRDRRGAAVGVLELSDQAIASSGDYERFVVIDGVAYAHIMDPRTGRPVQSMAQTTAAGPSAMWCDILSTSFFINGPKFTEAFVVRNPDVLAVLCGIVGDKLQWSEYVGEDWKKTSDGIEKSPDRVILNRAIKEK